MLSSSLSFTFWSSSMHCRRCPSLQSSALSSSVTDVHIVDHACLHRYPHPHNYCRRFDLRSLRSCCSSTQFFEIVNSRRPDVSHVLWRHRRPYHRWRPLRHRCWTTFSFSLTLSSSVIIVLRHIYRRCRLHHHHPHSYRTLWMLVLRARQFAI